MNTDIGNADPTTDPDYVDPDYQYRLYLFFGVAVSLFVLALLVIAFFVFTFNGHLIMLLLPGAYVFFRLLWRGVFGE